MDIINKTRRQYLLFKTGAAVSGCAAAIAGRTALWGTGACSGIMVTDSELFLFVGGMAVYIFICGVIAGRFFAGKIKALKKARRVMYYTDEIRVDVTVPGILGKRTYGMFLKDDAGAVHYIKVRAGWEKRNTIPGTIAGK